MKNAKRERRFTLWGGFSGSYSDAPWDVRVDYHIWHGGRVQAWMKTVGERVVSEAFAKYGEEAFDSWLAQNAGVHNA